MSQNDPNFKNIWQDHERGGLVATDAMGNLYDYSKYTELKNDENLTESDALETSRIGEILID